MNRDDVEIREYRPGDEQRILDTFNLVFREVCGPGFVRSGSSTASTR
jgi:hypothetical protein